MIWITVLLQYFCHHFFSRGAPTQLMAKLKVTLTNLRKSRVVRELSTGCSRLHVRGHKTSWTWTDIAIFLCFSAILYGTHYFIKQVWSKPVHFILVILPTRTQTLVVPKQKQSVIVFLFPKQILTNKYENGNSLSSLTTCKWKKRKICLKLSYRIFFPMVRSSLTSPRCLIITN